MFANTLRLDVAIRMMNMKKSPEAISMAREQIEKALNENNRNYLFSSNSDNAAGRYGTDPNADVSLYSDTPLVTPYSFMEALMPL